VDIAAAKKAGKNSVDAAKKAYDPKKATKAEGVASARTAEANNVAAANVASLKKFINKLDRFENGMLADKSSASVSSASSMLLSLFLAATMARLVQL